MVNPIYPHIQRFCVNKLYETFEIGEKLESKIDFNAILCLPVETVIWRQIKEMVHGSL